MSVQKAQGTRYESQVADELRQFLTGLGLDAASVRRLAEGGSGDEGDVDSTLFGMRVVHECKARQSLAVQATVAKATRKAGGPAIVWWKRLTRKPGNKVRTPVAGVPEVVVMEPEVFLALLETAYRRGLECCRCDVV